MSERKIICLACSFERVPPYQWPRLEFANKRVGHVCSQACKRECEALYGPSIELGRD